jgi:hypothetical protein
MDAAHDRKLTGYYHAAGSSYDDVSSEKTARLAYHDGIRSSVETRGAY